jgi:hypothetical protein
VEGTHNSSYSESDESADSDQLEDQYRFFACVKANYGKRGLEGVGSSARRRTDCQSNERGGPKGTACVHTFRVNRNHPAAPPPDFARGFLPAFWAAVAPVGAPNGA